MKFYHVFLILVDELMLINHPNDYWVIKLEGELAIDYVDNFSFFFFGLLI
jgi:hypothetical protein